MSRFDKYLKKEKNKKSEDSKESKTLDIWEFLKNDSPLIKYSMILGDKFFKILFIKKISINISRLIFKKYKRYRLNDSIFEENISKSYLGLLYFFIILLILLKFNLYIFLVTLIVCYFNINTIKNYVLEDVKKTIEISSDEVLEFLSWIIVLLETGMSINLSFNYYTNFSKSNLKKLVEEEINKVNAGKISLDMALGDLSINMKRQDLREIFTLILQSKKLGVSIKDSLSNYLDRYQDSLFINAEKRGASANQKATFILTAEVFLLMIIFLIGLISTLLTGGVF